MLLTQEYKAHVVDKKCPAGACKALLNYKILEDKCIGCGMCLRSCPVGAISPTTTPAKNPRLFIHNIDTSKCIKCGSCLASCRIKAIIKG